jgi:hypothetical protein
MGMIQEATFVHLDSGHAKKINLEKIGQEKDNQRHNLDKKDNKSHIGYKFHDII